MATNIKNTGSQKYKKSLSLDDRISIASFIETHRSPNGSLSITLNNIAANLEKDPTTISKEVKNRRIMDAQKSYNFARTTTYCLHCDKKNNCESKKKLNSSTKGECRSFTPYVCPQLKKFPWVCNGCPKRGYCQCQKAYYKASDAQNNYELKLKESREGINMPIEEFNTINQIISRGIDKGQSIEHILHSNDIQISTSTAYNYLHKGYFDTNMAKTHRMCRRRTKYRKLSYNSKMLKKLKEGRNYEDFVALRENNPNLIYTEMDTIEGRKGGKLVLSLKVVNVQFQFYFLIENKEASTIVNKLNEIQSIIGLDNFKNIFGVILTDNGTEFTDILGIISDPNTGEIRTNLFFCQPGQSGQKGSCEQNHELFRYILPKGKSFDSYEDSKYELITSHVNSYKRQSIEYSTPYEKFVCFFGKEILEKLNIKLISPNEVLLKPELLK